MMKDFEKRLDEILDAFDLAYDELYEDDDMEQQRNFTAIHDGFMKAVPGYQEFVQALAKRRGDFFVSDRETAALVVAITRAGLGMEATGAA